MGRAASAILPAIRLTNDSDCGATDVIPGKRLSLAEIVSLGTGDTHMRVRKEYPIMGASFVSRLVATGAGLSLAAVGFAAAAPANAASTQSNWVVTKSAPVVAAPIPASKAVTKPIVASQIPTNRVVTKPSPANVSTSAVSTQGWSDMCVKFPCPKGWGWSSWEWCTFGC